MVGYVMGSKRLTPTIVGKIASKRLLLLFRRQFSSHLLASENDAILSLVGIPFELLL